MSIREVARRLRAWQGGRPLPRYQTRHIAVAPQVSTLIVAFVRMAGESRPWGIAWGHPGAEPRLVAVPDGRVRDDVAVMCADFSEELLAHFRVHNWSYDPIGQQGKTNDLRQLWVPNGQHVAMLHNLNYAYAQTTSGGTNVTILNALGRLSGWLFRDSSRRGEQHLIDASAALRESFVFPAEDARQAHLGYLLGWLSPDEPHATRDQRLADAFAAEQTPVSPTMDPTLERNELEPLLDRRLRLRREGGTTDEVDAKIESIISGEARRRWLLCDSAYALLANDSRPTNPGVDDLVALSLQEFWWKIQAVELKVSDPSGGKPFVPHPETDSHGSSAAADYLRVAAADERYVNLLIHDDDELFAESLADGHAVRVRVTRVDDRGQGRVTTPVWSVDVLADTVGRLREGSRLVPRGSSGHHATITSLAVTEDGIHLEVEWQARKTQALGTGAALKPIDTGWVNEVVDFIPSDAADLTLRRSRKVWDAAKGPGAWLTHGKPNVFLVPDSTDDESSVDLILDDVAQLERSGDAG